MMRSTRRSISAAARREKVSSRMRPGSAPLTIRWATRCASVLVLPEPAPAITSSGPATLAPLPATPCATAQRCSAFKVSRYFAPDMNRTPDGDRPGDPDHDSFARGKGAGSNCYLGGNGCLVPTAANAQHQAGHFILLGV